MSNKWSVEKLTFLFNNIHRSNTELTKAFSKKGWEDESRAIGSLLETCEEVLQTPLITENTDLESLLANQRDEEVVGEMLNSLEDEICEHIHVIESKRAEQRYLVINDAHIPFHRKKALEAIIEQYAGKDYILVLLGDMLDCHDISSFPKAYSVGLGKEIVVFKEYLQDWSEKFDKIIIVSGNHEKRLATYLRKRLSLDVVQFMPDDIIQKIVEDLKLDNIEYCTGDTFSWYIQIDNVILAHPITFSQPILGTTIKVMEYFSARGTSANVFISAHTHRLGIAIHNGNVLVESGCLCLPQDYSMEGKVTYKPQANGYLTFVSRNNKVGFNDIRLYNI